MTYLSLIQCSLHELTLGQVCTNKASHGVERTQSCIAAGGIRHAALLPIYAVEVQQSTLEQTEANVTLGPDTRSPENPSFRGKRVLPFLYTL